MKLRRCQHLFALGLVALSLFVVGRSATADEQSFRVMSFNIRGDFAHGKATDRSEAWIAKSGDHRRELVIEVIRDYGPDLLGVQEAYQNQMGELSAALVGYEFYGLGREDGDTQGEYSAIFYRTERFARTGHGSFWLSKEPDAAGSKHPDAAAIRIASWVTLTDRRTDGRETFVLNTHWDHVSQESRLYSAGLIAQRVKSLSGNRPVIVLGDLNADEDNPALATLRGAKDADGRQLRDGYRDLVPERDPNEATYHAFTGKRAGSRIDFILHTDELRTTRAAIVRTDFNGRYPSDHFPVTATLVPSEGR